MSKRVPEVAIGRVVVSWLEAEGWDVWQEVGVSSGGGVCDIVAKRGPAIHAVECKSVANLDVLEQASWWVGRAHFVSVAVPLPRRERLYASFAKSLGVGVIWVENGWHQFGDNVLLVRTWDQGAMSRPREDKYRRPLSYFLTDERKHWPAEAGTIWATATPRSGKRVTTCDTSLRRVPASRCAPLSSGCGATTTPTTRLPAPR